MCVHTPYVRTHVLYGVSLPVCTTGLRQQKARSQQKSEGGSGALDEIALNIAEEGGSGALGSDSLIAFDKT